MKCQKYISHTIVIVLQMNDWLHESLQNLALHLSTRVCSRKSSAFFSASITLGRSERKIMRNEISTRNKMRKFPRCIKEVLFWWNNKESLTSIHSEYFLISFPKPGTTSTLHYLTHAPTTNPSHSSIIALCMSHFFGPWNNYCELLYMFPKLMISTWHLPFID